MADREKKRLTDTNSIKELEDQANNTRHLVDRLNRALYGMTWDEHERLHGAKEEQEEIKWQEKKKIFDPISND